MKVLKKFLLSQVCALGGEEKGLWFAEGESHVPSLQLQSTPYLSGEV